MGARLDQEAEGTASLLSEVVAGLGRLLKGELALARAEATESVRSAGAGLVIGLNWEMNSLFVPPITAGIMAAPRVHVTRGSVTDLTMEGNPYYATGYARVGRSKRVVRCLIASFVGIGVGLAVRQLVINPTLDYE